MVTLPLLLLRYLRIVCVCVCCAVLWFAPALAPVRDTKGDRPSVCKGCWFGFHLRLFAGVEKAYASNSEPVSARSFARAEGGREGGREHE